VVSFVEVGDHSLFVGEVMEAEVPDGFVLPHDAWTHRVENVGSTDVRAIIYETK
jgi:flavin reductase (DIM6/NTAB) family NADH-FMN oxidoreductase RutF